MTADLEHLRGTWLSTRDGEAGHEYGDALESAPQVGDARKIYGELIEAGYLIGYWDLAWLEHAAGNTARARAFCGAIVQTQDQAG